MKRKSNKTFVVYIVCATVIFLFSVFFLGGFLKWFKTVPYFDKCLHLLSAALIFGVLAIWLCYKSKTKPLHAALFVFCFAVMIGVLFEMTEFTIDSLFSSNHQHWIASKADKFGFWGTKKQGSGLVDTMGDIVGNTIGAAIAAIVGYFWLKEKFLHFS